MSSTSKVRRNHQARLDERFNSPKYDSEIEDSELDIDKGVELGAGGKACVYRGNLRRRRKSVEVAIKVPGTTDKDAKTEDHVKTQKKKLKKKVFVKYFGVYRHVLKGLHTLCIVMEQLRGQSLAYHLKHSYAEMSLLVKVNILLQVAKAVEFAHSKNVLVTDLKPGNIMFYKMPNFARNANLHLKLIDVSQHEHTTRYASPETLNDEKHFTKETDIYTFGLVMWEMFAGRLPYCDCPESYQCDKKTCECLDDLRCAYKIWKTGKLKIPETAPRAISDLIEQCWQTPCVTTMSRIVLGLRHIYNDARAVRQLLESPIQLDHFSLDMSYLVQAINNMSLKISAKKSKKHVPKILKKFQKY